MKLDQFIKSTLTSIANGVHEANQEYKKTSQETRNMFCLDSGSDKNKGTGVHFDLFVTSKKEGNAGASADFNIFVIDATIGTKGKIVSESANRINFTISVDFQIY